MKHVVVLVARIVTIGALSSITPLARAENPDPPDPGVTEVEVTAQREIPFVDPRPDTMSVQDQVSKEAIDTLAGPAQTGSYKTIGLLPSVNDQSADAYGLALGKTLRVRGSYESDAFLRNIEGLPVSSHGGGGDFIDLENVQSVTMYRGGIPSENSFGVRNLTGMMNLSLRWPQGKMDAVVKQSVGAYGFLRSYGRVDSGELPTGTRVFASFSWTTADKWRGSGGSPNSRTNVEVGISQTLGSQATLRVFGVFHLLDQNDYRALTFAQKGDFDNYYKYDFNSQLTGDPAKDQFYYGYTRQHYRDAMVLADLTIKPKDGSRITIKPYFWSDVGYRLMGRGNGYARLDINPTQYGAVAEYARTFVPIDVSLGYWIMAGTDTLPPPLSQKTYALQPTQPGTSNATFAGYSMLGKIQERIYHSPYLNIRTKLANADISAGLRYSYRVNPRTTFYQTQGLADLSYSDALKQPLAEDSTMQIARRAWSDWLPSAGVRYAFIPGLSAFFSYARAYDYDAWAGQLNTFTNNRPKFTAAGVGLNDIWGRLQPESIDNFDLGVRFEQSGWIVAPTGFYGIHRHKTVTVYDTTIGVPYLQSNANSRSYGAELEIAGRICKGLGIYFASSYNKHTFNSDIQNASNNTVNSKDKQVPDSPVWLVKVAPSWSGYGFRFVPILRYVGVRYGDVENKEKVADYVVVDLDLTYKRRLFGVTEVTANLAAMNLFNRRHIGVINTSDFALSNGVTYYPAAPITVMGSLALGL